MLKTTLTNSNRPCRPLFAITLTTLTSFVVSACDPGHAELEGLCGPLEQKIASCMPNGQLPANFECTSQITAKYQQVMDLNCDTYRTQSGADEVLKILLGVLGIATAANTVANPTAQCNGCWCSTPGVLGSPAKTTARGLSDITMPDVERSQCCNDFAEYRASDVTYCCNWANQRGTPQLCYKGTVNTGGPYGNGSATGRCNYCNKLSPYYTYSACTAGCSPCNLYGGCYNQAACNECNGGNATGTATNALGHKYRVQNSGCFPDYPSAEWGWCYRIIKVNNTGSCQLQMQPSEYAWDPQYTHGECDDPQGSTGGCWQASVCKEFASKNVCEAGTPTHAIPAQRCY